MLEAVAQSLLHKASWRKEILCVIMMKGGRKRNRTDVCNAWDTDNCVDSKCTKWISKLLFLTLFNHKRVPNIQRGKNNRHSAPQCGCIGVRERKIYDPLSLLNSFDHGHTVTFELKSLVTIIIQLFFINVYLVLQGSLFIPNQSHKYLHYRQRRNVVKY